MDDLDQQRVYEFPCGRWLAVDEDDGQISRDLYCGISETDAAPGVPYTIQVLCDIFGIILYGFPYSASGFFSWCGISATLFNLLA